ncbi:MAG TPA: flagellar filament capping protein FliD [Sinomonas sp.]|nr:flagellar filament capping protein FliD [Sinomonas sp.]
MSTLSMNGLGSGLDITSMVNALIQVEGLPQQQLQQTKLTDQSMITNLQIMNSKASSLATLATNLAMPSALNLYTVSSSSTAVTATAGTGASPGTVSVRFDQIAQTQVDVTAAMGGWPTDGSGAAAAVTFVDAAGKQTEVTPASTSLDDVVAAINASGGPATAMKVAAGKDASGNPLYRLQLTAVKSGAGAAFTVYQGAAAQVTAGTAADLMTQPGAAVVTQAQDAQATLYAGTAAEQAVTSSSNTFSDIIPGLTAMATQAAVGQTVTFTIAGDNEGVEKQANSLVTSINDLLSNISQNTSVTTSINSTGGSSATGGLFTGNSTVRAVQDAITNALYMPTSNGKSPSDLGISIQQDGSFVFDQTTLDAAMTADSKGTIASLQEIASRVSAAAKNASDPTQGSLTSLIAGRQAEVAQLSDQISDWDTRLADRKDALMALFNAMDTSLGTLKAQQSWLTSQIAGLPTYSSSSSK